MTSGDVTTKNGSTKNSGLDTMPTLKNDESISVSGNNVNANPEIRVLGHYVPSAYQSEIIETEIRSFLPDCCKRERISVRVPMGIEPMSDNLKWHQDGGGPEGTTRHMVIWASETPTHLRYSDKTVAIVMPFEVVWFNNDTVFHRQPSDANEKTRWFVSIRCSGVTS